jgi:N-acetylneuraminate synthase
LVSAIAIAGRRVGPGRPAFIIAEAGVNHNGETDRALALVEAAAQAGADAVKFQSFLAGEVAAPSAPKAAYQERATGPGQSQYEMLKALELAPEDHRLLAERCRRLGLVFLSTPFDLPSLELLAGLGMPACKVPSGEITNLPFLRRVGAVGWPVILSTGMSELEEVALAVETLSAAGCAGLALLQCVSNYPAEAADANLRAMATLAERFGAPVGYSDHTLGIEVALAAAALGACIIEKHFTLDRGLAGPDHAASAEPAELAALVAGVRKVEAALGDGLKRPAPAEADTRAAARRSLVAARDIAAGERLEPEAVCLRRPGTGLAPGRLGEVLGKRARAAIAAGALLRLEDLE